MDSDKNGLIAKLKKKIQDLEVEKEMFDDIMNHIPGHVYWLNKNNVYVGCNTEHAIHVGLQNRKDIVGKTNFDMPWKEKAEEVNSTNNKVMKSGSPFIIKESGIVMGVHAVYLSNKVPLRNKDHEIVGLLGISIDITEQEKLQKQLKLEKAKAECANEAKTEFIANMSHDIRTPLSGVVGLGGIAEKEINNPDAKAKVHDMVQSADELLNMLNEILEVVSLDNTTVNDIHEEPFDLPHLVQTIVDLEKASIDLKNIKLLHSIDTKIPSLLVGDYKKIHHILLNLVSNAIKFTEKGHVHIKIKLSNKLKNKVKLLFEVADTGQGIPKESLEQVFEIFYKITPSYKGLGKGHGIGLHIVKTYVELLGGKVRVASKENKGSKFSFSLTLKTGDKNGKPQNIINKSLIERSEEPPLFASNSEYKESTPTFIPNAPEILIIEDNDIARKVAISLVKGAKCNPTAATNGETGLKLAKTKHFSLIVTDIGLPGMSGIEFAKQFRTYEKQTNNKPMPIVAITGHAKGKIRDECIAAGINEVIIKPIRPEILDEVAAKFSLFKNSESQSDSSKASTPDNPTSVNAELDLPENEDELFEIDNEMIFDIKSATKILGEDNADLLMQMLKETINTGIPEELPRLQKAHDEGNWQAVADISHKLKGGFLSISLNRAATACKYLERYHKAGKTELLEKLYQQVLKILEETSNRLKDFTK